MGVLQLLHLVERLQAVILIYGVMDKRLQQPPI